MGAKMKFHFPALPERKINIFATLIEFSKTPERCQSGRTSKPGKFVYEQSYRGFESHPLRSEAETTPRKAGVLFFRSLRAKLV